MNELWYMNDVLRFATCHVWCEQGDRGPSTQPHSVQSRTWSDSEKKGRVWGIRGRTKAKTPRFVCMCVRVVIASQTLPISGYRLVTRVPLHKTHEIAPEEFTKWPFSIMRHGRLRNIKGNNLLISWSVSDMQNKNVIHKSRGALSKKPFGKRGRGLFQGAERSDATGGRGTAACLTRCRSPARSQAGSKAASSHRAPRRAREIMHGNVR